MKNKNLGFTLIELLAIIALVGILIGLLIPCIASTKDKAMEASCTNNIRQLVLVAQIYTDEHNESIPDIPNLASYIDNEAVFICPRDTRTDAEFDPAFKTSFSACNLTPKSMLPSDVNGLLSETVLYIESNKLAETFAERANVNVISGLGELDIKYRHRKGKITVISFLDSHVTTYREGQSVFIQGAIPPPGNPPPPE